MQNNNYDLLIQGGESVNITDIRIRRVSSAGRMKAVVSVTFDNQFVVHDIKVVEGNNGYFVAMPSRKGADGEFRDVAHPITTETRNMMQTMILDAYNEQLEAEEA
jgi:stage V sporulation protein G